MITLAEIKTQLTELYLADGYTFDEAHEMIEAGEITWKGKRGCIQHVNGKVDQFKITEVVSWIEPVVCTDPFITATEWMFEDQVCAPEIKANNHKVWANGWDQSVAEYMFTEFVRKADTHKVWVDQLINEIHVNGKRVIETASWAADEFAESFMHQVFIDYTNENTNRV